MSNDPFHLPEKPSENLQVVDLRGLGPAKPLKSIEVVADSVVSDVVIEGVVDGAAVEVSDALEEEDDEA